MADTIKSTFNKDAEGWTMQDASPANWVASGGNPGGYFTWTDSNNDDSYYSAPKEFTGDKGGFYGGTLQYDVIDSTVNYGNVPDVELIAKDGTTLVATVGQAGTSWTHLSVELDKSGGWHVGTLDGDVASKHEIKQVLNHLASLWIRAEYAFGGETGGLDNVILSKPAANAGALAVGSAHSAAHDVLHALQPSLAHLDHAHLAIA